MRSTRIAATSVLALLLFAAWAHSASASPGYVTIFADRAQLVDVDPETCAARPGAVTLPTVMDALSQRGLQLTFGIVTGFIDEPTNQCRPPALYPSWQQLAAWHAAYGFEATSNGATKLHLDAASDEQIRSESCGSLAAFTDHGFDRAWALFSYPDDLWTPHAQSIVNQCFAYGRDYNNKVNVRPVADPDFAYVKSVRGGDCAIASPTCDGADSLAYLPPSALLQLKDFTNPGPDKWRVIQFYRFVEGAQPGLWDCTDPDDRYHWTYSVEAYCWNDFLTIIDTIAPPTITTDPATVADAWGRTDELLHPYPVTDLTADTSAPGLVTLSWTNPAGAFGDIVRRGEPDGPCPTTPTDGTAIGGSDLRTQDTDPAAPSGRSSCYAVFTTGVFDTPSEATTATATPTSPITTTTPTVTLQPATPLTKAGLVPLLVTWSSTAPSGICNYDATASIDDADPSPLDLASPTATTLATTAPPGHSYQYSVRATDCAGNVGPWIASATEPLDDAMQDDSSRVTLSRGWKTGSSPKASSGSYVHAKTAGRTATITFTGTEIALYARTAANEGAAHITIDGTPAGTIDLQSPATTWREPVYTSGTLTEGEHTLRLTVDGTPGHPRVDLDSAITLG